MTIHPPTWTAPPIWQDGECYIIGGGPSVNSTDLSLLKGRRVIAVNQAYKLGRFDVLFYGDCPWWQRERDNLTDWPGLIVHACCNWEGIGRVKRIKRTKAIGPMEKNPALLAWNLSSGACAINLAVHFGVKRIVLIGFDMRKVDGETNFHHDHPHHKRKQGKSYNPYARFLQPFPVIAKSLQQLGIECINATPGSALEVFPIMTLEEAVGIEVLC